MSVVYGALCVVSFVLAGPAIRLIYGPQFHAAIELYLWLVPGVFCLGMLSILSQHFAGRGFPVSEQWSCGSPGWV